MPRSLATMLDPIAKKAVGKDWAVYATLLDRWKEIVGTEYAQVSSPVKVSFPHQPNAQHRQGGTLTIRIPKGLALEFTYKVEIVRQRVNNYFGYEAFAKIAFDPVAKLPEVKREPLPLDDATRATITASAAVIDDPELRAALERLGESVHRAKR